MKSDMSIDDLIKLHKMKKENPKEYEEFLQATKGILKDMMKIAEEISEEME